MLRALILLAAMAFVTGCGTSRSPKVHNPVTGPPPPRVSGDKQALGHGYDTDLGGGSHRDPAGSPIARMSLVKESGAGDAVEIPDSMVVASVNGAPIFASEVLGRYKPRLMQLKQQLPPQEYVKVRKTLLARDLRGHIERKLLADSMKKTLEDEQLKMIDEQLGLMFDKEDVPRLLKQFHVNTKAELELELNKLGESLENLKTGLSNQRIAMEYLGTKSPTVREATRQDLLSYYQEHLEEYAVSAKVRWQQIEISFTKNGGRRGALSVLNRVVGELKNQAEFGDVAGRYSNGPTADSGGNWDWTGKGSLSDKEVERYLFELPVGQISQVIEGPDNFQLVRVLERQDAGHIPFEKVQDDIKSTIRRKRRGEATATVIRDLMKTAVIWTIFDTEQEAPAISSAL